MSDAPSLIGQTITIASPTFIGAPSGKTLGLLRSHEDSDVVLLRKTASAH